VTTFFTADTHFGHGGALGLFRRPFPDVASMDAAIAQFASLRERGSQRIHCELNGIEPFAWLGDVLTRMVDGHSARQLDELLPWAVS